MYILLYIIGKGTYYGYLGTLNLTALALAQDYRCPLVFNFKYALD